MNISSIYLSMCLLSIKYLSIFMNILSIYLSMSLSIYHTSINIYKHLVYISVYVSVYLAYIYQYL